MNNQIKNAILNGRLVVFIGAGASKTSSSYNDIRLPDGALLASKIALLAGWDYNDEPLKTVYSAAEATVPEQLNQFFKEVFVNCKPSEEYLKLASYPWPRLYTTNIDDALENAFKKNSQQNVHVMNRGDSVKRQDVIFSSLDIIKLNGCASRPEQGFIFSPREYGKSSANMPPWYAELGADFFQYTFLFVGTKLDEPLFYHQIERYKLVVNTGVPRSYVITPSATPIEVESLRSLNLDHISATLSDFVNWLEEEIPAPPSVIDMACANNPSLKKLLSDSSIQAKEEYADLLKDVVIITRQNLESSTPKAIDGMIRNFYRGFKPTWRDILDDVPASLVSHNDFYDFVKSKAVPGSILSMYGPAGSGKSTVLKTTAVKLAIDQKVKVYYIDKAQENFCDVARALEGYNENYYLMLDRLDVFRDGLKEAFQQNIFKKGIVVGCEGQHIWQSRVKHNLIGYSSGEYKLSEINEVDADPILNKIELYGPWTRLSKISKKNRKIEIIEKSKRQLLIGLLEATSGVGFEQLIEKDYSTLTDAGKTLVVLVSLCTIHRQIADESLVGRALAYLEVTELSNDVSDEFAGIITNKNGGYIARHPVYARQILGSVVDMGLLEDCIRALLSAFTVFPHPVVRSLDKPQSIIFKSILNHRFLKEILRENEQRVISVYSRYEKHFESDGLFWLQYGLALRGYNLHDQAYDKLMTAHHAYSHDHTSHALAQQEMIIASLEDTTNARASDLLSKAISKLEALDYKFDSDDTYPLVTMAEGHTRAIIKIDGEQVARVVAKDYCKRLQEKMRLSPGARLTGAYSRLLKFATTGNWSFDNDYYDG